jgi:cell division protein FtsZ
MINFHPNSGELKPKITVIGVGGAGGNAVNNMILSNLEGVEFIIANTDAQAISQSRTDRRIQMGGGLGAGAKPEVGRLAAEEAIDSLIKEIAGSNMVFIAAGMGGGTGTGAAPVIAKAAREQGILTVGVVTKPFHFEGPHRMRQAEAGITELAKWVDTLMIIPNQNLFRVAKQQTTFSEAFKMADDVLYSGVRGVTDLMVMPGLINLDFSDIRSVMSEMGKAMMGTGQAGGEGRGTRAAEAAINNPLLEDISVKGARGILINITGGSDLTLFDVDEAMDRIRTEVDPEANIIFGSTFDESLVGEMRVSVVATGIDAEQEAIKRELAEQKLEALQKTPAPFPRKPEFKEEEISTISDLDDAEPLLLHNIIDDNALSDEEPKDLVQGVLDIDKMHHQPSINARIAQVGEAVRALVDSESPASEKIPTPQQGLSPQVSSQSDNQDYREPPRRQSFFDRLKGTRNNDRKPPAPETQTRVAPSAPSMPSLDTSSSSDKSMSNDSDMLEVPAFLRRQQKP